MLQMWWGQEGGPASVWEEALSMWREPLGKLERQSQENRDFAVVVRAATEPLGLQCRGWLCY